MQTVIKAAQVTATTDLGEFTAIAAAYSLDRAGDVIAFGAFAKTIAKWQASGKRIPLHWNHSGSAHDIIGSVDPASLEEIEALGLQVAGRLDIDASDTAKEAWRSMKGGAMSLSFGYMVLKADKPKDGAQVLRELDLFEISIVPVPANPDTRILSMKATPSLDQTLQKVEDRLSRLEASLEDLQGRSKVDVTDKGRDARSVDLLKTQAQAAALEVRSGGLSTKQFADPVPASEPQEDPSELRRQARSWVAKAYMQGIEHESI